MVIISHLCYDKDMTSTKKTEKQNVTSSLIFWIGLGLLMLGLCLQFLWLPNAPDSVFDCDRSSNEMCPLGKAFTFLFLFWIMDIAGFIMMVIYIVKECRHRKKKNVRKR